MPCRAYFSDNWFDGIRFPSDDVERIAAAGRVPFVRMMPRSHFSDRGADERYTMQSIVSGRWDADLRRWCANAASAGIPLLVDFGIEVNGQWFPWNGRWNGGGRTWFFHVEVGSYPAVAWNARLGNYYPGDSYVDWIGISDYGPLVPGERWRSFRRRLDRVYPQLEALAAPGDKPNAVLEYGARESRHTPARKARWIRAAIRSVRSDRYPRIAALSYWHERWRNGDGSVSDLRIDSSRRARRAYRRAVDGPRLTSEPSFEPR